MDLTAITKNDVNLPDFDYTSDLVIVERALGRLQMASPHHRGRLGLEEASVGLAVGLACHSTQTRQWALSSVST